MIFRKISFVFLLHLWSVLIFAQSEIYLQNPSFEGEAQAGRSPLLWYDCGFSGESPIDTHTASSDFFGVEQIPSEGNSYIGMVTRDNDTWESICQRLLTPLERNQLYQIEIDLCRSPYYKSISRTTNQVELYTTPILLRIWGGNEYCNRIQLLGQSEVVKTLNG